MIAVNLNIRDEMYDKVMYLLDSLPKQDVQIVKKGVIEEIDPTALPKNHFDYMSQEELDKIDKEIAQAKADGFKNAL